MTEPASRAEETAATARPDGHSSPSSDGPTDGAGATRVPDHAASPAAAPRHALGAEQPEQHVQPGWPQESNPQGYDTTAAGAMSPDRSAADLGDQSTPVGYGSNPAGYGSNPAGYGSNPAGHGSTPEGHGSTPAVQEADRSTGQPTSPAYTTDRVAFRRPDVLAGLLLLLAGLAAAVSLLPTWVPGRDTGLELVQNGVDTARGSFADVFGDSGAWQPLAIVLGGGVLAVLGLLMFLPARKHRLLGLLALVVAGIIVAAVLVPLAAESWQLGVFDIGFYFALAVAVLGLLGALKAVLTGPKYGTKAPKTS